MDPSLNPPQPPPLPGASSEGPSGIPANPPVTVTNSGKNSVGCIVAGCAVALLGFIAVIVVGVILLLPKLKARFDELSGTAPSATVGASSETPEEYFTFSFEPSEWPPLALGSSEVIEDDAWPETIGDFTYDDGAHIENPLYDSQIGGATYFQENGTLQFYIIVAPYDELGGFANLVNSTVEMEFLDGAPDLEFVSGLPIFYAGKDASTKFTMLALQNHAAYVTMETTDGSALSNEQLIETALVIFDALTGQTAPEASAVEAPAANLVPAPLIAATFGYDEGNARELKLSAGPALADDVAWPEPEATEAPFSLTRAGVDLPGALANFTGEAAGYSALNFDLDASRPLTAAFFPVGDGQTLEQAFAAVLSALANQAGTVAYEGYEGFFVTDENDAKIAEVAVQTLTTPAGLVSLAAFENGVLVIIPETAGAEEPADAFASERELALKLLNLFSVEWADTALGL